MQSHIPPATTISHSQVSTDLLEPQSASQQQSRIQIYSESNSPSPAVSEVQETLPAPNTTPLVAQTQSQYQVSNPIALDPAISPTSIQSIIQPIDLISDSPPPRPQRTHPMSASQIHSVTTSEQITNINSDTIQRSQNSSAKWRFPRPAEDSEEDARPTKKKPATTLGDAISLLSEKKYDFLTRQLEQQGKLRERELILEQERLQLETAKAKREERQLELQNLQFQTMITNLSHSAPATSSRHSTLQKFTTEPAPQTINPSINQSTNHSINQSPNQSRNEFTSQPKWD